MCMCAIQAVTAKRHHRTSAWAVVCPQAHFLKNGDAQITQAVAGLSTQRRLLMSGASSQQRCTVTIHVCCLSATASSICTVALCCVAQRLNSICVSAAGTPIQNDLSEFHAVFDLACPSLLGTLNTFRKVYEGPIQRGRDADATGKQVGPCQGTGPTTQPTHLPNSCRGCPSRHLCEALHA